MALNEGASAGGTGVNLEDVLITDLLMTRPAGECRDKQELECLLDLANAMESGPDRLLRVLVDRSREICKADASGISFVEIDPKGEEVFRCASASGTLAENAGSCAPRNSMPSAICLDRNAPQLFAHPERYFPRLREMLNLPVTEFLVVPLSGGKLKIGTVWLISHKQDVTFNSGDAQLMSDMAKFASCILRQIETLRTEREARMQDELEIASQTFQLQNLSAALFNAQDNERRRIARELHDDLSQEVTAIKWFLRTIPEDAYATAAWNKCIYESLDAADHVLERIRSISHLLHPPLLDIAGLRAALGSYIEGAAKRTGLEITLMMPESFPRLPKDLETAVFRIVQESLANVYRHSGSKSAEVELAYSASGISVRVRDYGVGVPPHLVSRPNAAGVGLSGMRERARLCGGKLDIYPVEPGTLVEANFPIELAALRPEPAQRPDRAQRRLRWAG